MYEALSVSSTNLRIEKVCDIGGANHKMTHPLDVAMKLGESYPEFKFALKER